MSKHNALNRFGRSGNPAFRNHFNTNQTTADNSVRKPSYQNHLHSKNVFLNFVACTIEIQK